MPIAALPDVELYYESDGSGPSTIVFAHGGEGTHLHWWQQVAALAPHHRCVTYDARGFGRSSAAPSANGTATHRLDLLGLLDFLEVPRAFVVGHSMGGYAASGLARNNPERVHALIMSDTPFGLPTPELAVWAEAMIGKLEGGFDVIAACLGPGFRERRPDLAFLFDALGRLNPPRTGPRGFDAYREMMAQPVPDYSGWQIPTLFIVGDRDELTVPPLIRATAAAIPGAELVEIATSGHSAYFEQADAFNGALRSFIDRHPM